MWLALVGTTNRPPMSSANPPPIKVITMKRMIDWNIFFVGFWAQSMLPLQNFLLMFPVSSYQSTGMFLYKKPGFTSYSVDITNQYVLKRINRTLGM